MYIIFIPAWMLESSHRDVFVYTSELITMNLAYPVNDSDVGVDLFAQHE
jgi:hypothetical protein